MFWQVKILWHAFQINLPMNSVVPGSELTKEPFRWDQRIFGLVLRLPGNVPVDMTTSTYIPSAESHPLDAMCDVTGGKTENEIFDFFTLQQFV